MTNDIWKIFWFDPFSISHFSFVSREGWLATR